jgi:hypothetical protein
MARAKSRFLLQIMLPSITQSGSSSCITQCGREALKLWDEFKSRDYYTVSPKYGPREIVEEHKNIDGLFPCHARIYVFADRFDIAGLCILALDKLHQAPCSLKVAGAQMGTITGLIRFSYSNYNTRDREIGEDIDSLKSIVVHFVVCLFERIVKDNKFLKLIEERGCFARDLTGLFGKRTTGIG